MMHDGEIDVRRRDNGKHSHTATSPMVSMVAGQSGISSPPSPLSPRFARTLLRSSPRKLAFALAIRWSRSASYYK